MELVKDALAVIGILALIFGFGAWMIWYIGDED